jgi:2-polyprenyl-6-methoxyphenol hydroxylase-like FAD-dependent oxidoreductase
MHGFPLVPRGTGPFETRRALPVGGRSVASEDGQRRERPVTDRNRSTSRLRDQNAPSHRSSSRSDGQRNRTFSRPHWFPSDDIIAGESDRQVLVWGETVVGLVLTHLLDCAGYDPLLVAGADQERKSRVSYLWPSALRVLAAIGVDAAVRTRSLEIDAVSGRRFDDGRESEFVLSRDSDPSAAAPVLVRTRDLRRVLTDELPATVHRRERTVANLSRQDEGLAVGFANGVTEWFDAFVDAGTGADTFRPDDGETPASTGLWQYETTVDTSHSIGHRCHEEWRPNALVERLPQPGEAGPLLRVSSPSPELPASQGEELAENPWAGTDGVASELSGVQPVRVRQVGLLGSDTEAGRWASGRVAFCGRAALPLAPASGSAVSLGIESALAFVRELTREYRPMADVLDDYATARARRVVTLRRRAKTARTDHEYPTPQSAPSPFRTLGTVRSVALGPFLGGKLAQFQQNGLE